MKNSLLCSAVRMISERDFADSLAGTARAFEECCANLETKPLRDALAASGWDGKGPLRGWSFPDAVWSALSRKLPALGQYPLGEIAERAVKKTIIDLLPQSETGGPAGLMMVADESLIEMLLRSSLETADQTTRLRLLLSNYFFEIAIDYLRRPSKDEPQDWGYHFSASNRAFSTKAEHRYRESFATQCSEAAADFLPFLLKALQVSGTDIHAQIAGGLARLCAVKSSVKSSAILRKPFVNVVVGSRSIAELRETFTPDEKNLVRLVLDGERRNVTCQFPVLETFLGRPLHSLVNDFLEIGAAVYMSDLYCKRPMNLKRQIGLVMPVRHPDVWARAKPQLERAVSKLGRDAFTIHFQKKKEKAQMTLPFRETPIARCVSLFSGGIDSLAGAIWALKHGIQPILVSHFAAKRLSPLQQHLVTELRRIYSATASHHPARRKAGKPVSRSKAARIKQGSATAALVAGQKEHIIDNVHFYLSKREDRKRQGRKVPYELGARPHSIMAEHLRSFLFLTVACAIAVESGVKTVYVFENGPLALNPLLSEGTVTTSTAHPHFLAAFRDLVEAVFGVSLCIENPFLYKTKGEVAKILDEQEVVSLVKKSNSCWNWFKIQMDAQKMGRKHFNGTHDGLCLPCILRRASTDAAGLWDMDDKYLVDIFEEYPALSRETKIAIADLLRFCKNVATLSGPRLLSFAPDLSVCVEGTDPAAMVDMYRRHAFEVLECFRNHSNPQLQQDFKLLL